MWPRQVWSPGIRRRDAVHRGGGRGCSVLNREIVLDRVDRIKGLCGSFVSTRTRRLVGRRRGFHFWPRTVSVGRRFWWRRRSRGGQAARLLGPVGCDPRGPCTPGLSTWSSSRSLHSTQANGSLVSKRASRLDAFSAYPFPTWLPDDAPSGTAGTPEVGPPQSSRTRGDPSQASYAHGR